MVPSIRAAYNKAFTPEAYADFLKDLDNAHPGAIEFRVAETPVFIPKSFTDKLINACESIVDIITRPDFKELTARAIPEGLAVPGENEHTDCIAFDFGICENEKGELEPQLIEMQGFPTLFAYEVLLDDVFARHFSVPKGYSSYIGGYDRESYLQLLKEVIVGDYRPEEVILLELFPHQQKTRIDFYCTQDYLQVKPVCLTELIKEGDKLFYLDNGVKTAVKRIYNRIIFDDLQQQSPEVQEKGKLLFETLDVEWMPHPAWFYRISKYTLPFIDNPYVPPTVFLHELKEIPADLENYVLKPLFSFAGQGVVIDVRPEDITAIKDPENWILQRKVKYADVIETPDGPAKAEIRIFYFWKKGEARPVPANNLARLSKGKMIGVRYNKDKEWVGGSFCLFEQ
ncbi:hypothetical protein ACFS6H_14945 [Terrimonas rubra]|uniref:Circularly permuted type 2 ATP-grasp protein n=1 Tax=Terrimonas rubra TaxID=1035890 RepID=A0ABW6A9E3_9BACT